MKELKLIRFYEILRKISKVFATISGIAISVIMIFTIVTIIMRSVLGKPVVGANEMVEVLLAMFVFAAIIYSQTEKAHINLFLILLRLPEKLAGIIYAVDLLIVTAVAGAITYAMFSQAAYAVSKHLVSALLLIPYAPFNYAAAVCMMAFTVIMAGDTIVAAAGVFNKDYREYVRGTWI